MTGQVSGERGRVLARGSRTDTGEIVLDPHVAGSCVIILDEAAATALFDLLGEWLG